MRLPKLPIEFYVTSVLKEIGSVIGLVLRIDSYTAFETRGGYVRLCVLIAQELFYALDRKKGKIGYMVVKLDLEKAYDRLE